MVSTHSRLKAAGPNAYIFRQNHYSFNTQPPEGGWDNEALFDMFWEVSTHSRLKAAGKMELYEQNSHRVSTHSRLKAAGQVMPGPAVGMVTFQHTAA